MNDKIAEKFKKVLGDDSFDISGKKQDGLNISPVTEPEIKSILVATPMYGGMCTGHYTIALMNSINTLREMKVETLLASVMNESLIPRARNELARLFLDQTKCSHLMFVDSDMYFDEKAIASLYNADKDVACGIYPKKEIDWGKVSLAVKDGKNDLAKHSSSFFVHTLSIICFIF